MTALFDMDGTLWDGTLIETEDPRFVLDKDYFDNLPLTRKENKKIKELEPYTETEKVPSVVPEEILDEIPDLFTVKIPELEEEIENNNEEKISYESESLETVISEENTVTDNKAPFIMGGDSNE